jgi:hypothetical protein
VTVYFSVSPPNSQLYRITVSHAHFIEGTLKAPLRPLTELQGNAPSSRVIEETQQLKGSLLNLVITHGFCQGWCSDAAAKGVTASQSSITEPFCRYVNVELFGLQPRFGMKNVRGMILLENPFQENQISVQQLREEIEVLFGLWGQDFYFHTSNNEAQPTVVQDLTHLHKQILHVFRKGERQQENSKSSLNHSGNGPFCKFVNVECNGKRGTVLLENPCGNDVSETYPVHLLKQVSCIFGIDAAKLKCTSETREKCGHMVVEVK